MEKVFIVMIFILFIICLISIVVCYIKIDINTYNINNSKIDKDIRIVFLSDLHNRNIYKRLQRIINDIKPDIIVYGGDMVNGGINHIKNFIKLIDVLKNYKSYYVYGNHEQGIYVYNNSEYRKYEKYINKTNIVLLNNKSELISKNIIVFGLNPILDYYGRFGKKCLNKEIINEYIGNINKDNYNILITHNPLEFDSYIDCEYDLVLTGHVHGGAIQIPFIGGLLSPDFTFFPKYYGGKHTKKNTTMIVSRGLGFSTKLPFRMFNNPEVVVINLKNKKV